MQAIELTSKYEHYQDRFKKTVKSQQTTDFNRFAGTISLTEGPLELIA